LEDYLVKTVKFSIFLAVMALATSLALADIPQLINYQGRILDASGSTVPDGNYDISFSIYDAATGGEMKWSEIQGSVPVADGFFSTVLGSVTPLSDTVFGGSERYLEIGIGGEAISPRIQFTSGGYAFRIGTVDGAKAGQLSGALKLSPDNYGIEGNAITVTDVNNEPIFQVSVDAAGFSTVSFFEPADSKDASIASLHRSLDIGVSPTGSASIGFYDPVDSKDGAFAVPRKSMELSVDASGLGSVAFYEPADSKFGPDATPVKKVEVTKNGLIMFGVTEGDTSLYVDPNGDIVGLGQITMGQNSSSGTQTSVLGFNNDASGDSSSIGGGSYNVAYGTSSVIGGGFNNTAQGAGVTIGGGAMNNASGQYATIGGGLNNSAMGDYATIPGGEANRADGFYSYAAGHRAIAGFNGSFVWADQKDEDFASTAEDQFIIRADGGVGINTDSPAGILDVVGDPGDSSVNLPEDAISAGEVLDEPGISSEQIFGYISLPQGAASFQDVAVTTIAIPAPGYIMVNGVGTLEAYGTSKANQVYAQIDETAGGNLVNPYYVIVGAGDYDTPSSVHYFSVSTQRIYFKEAGTYEFRMEMQAKPSNNNDAVSTILNPVVTAVYFPTAYGAVTTTVAGSNSVR
jgi:hypothetical protein